MKKFLFTLVAIILASIANTAESKNPYSRFSGVAVLDSDNANTASVKANPNEEITLTVSSDGPTKDDAVKNALRLAIEQAYGAFVSANTTILNDELVKDEIVTISNGAIKEYKIISDARQPDGSGYVVTANATVSLPHLVTYAKNHGSECEFAGNTFGMDMKLFKLQKENELKALYNAIPMIVEFAKNNMQHVLHVDEPKMSDVNFDYSIGESTEFSSNSWDSRWKKGYERVYAEKLSIGNLKEIDNCYSALTAFFNKPITRPDGKPSYEKDDIIFNGVNEISNDENVLLRFQIRWLPIDDKNTLNDYVVALLSNLSLDSDTFDKYREQGYDVYDCSFYGPGESNYFRFRNSEKDIEEWRDSLHSALNEVKNNYHIIDNTGTISDFAPQELSNIIYKHVIAGKYNYYDAKLKDKKLIFKYTTVNGIETLHGEEFYSFPDKLHKAGRVDGRILCYGGKGLFSRLFIVDGEHNKYIIPEDSSSLFRQDPYLEVFTLIPVSEIGKYSSFKISTPD